MSGTLVDHVRATQASMIEPGRPHLTDSELDDMRCLVRLTVEFYHFLQGEDLAPGIDDKLRYVCESIFSGIDSFLFMSARYRMLWGARRAMVPSGAKSVDAVGEEFRTMYVEFSSTTDFELRFRLLLNLFKLQLVFAALSY